MSKLLRLMVLVLALVTIGCPSTKFVSTWKNPEAKEVNWKGKKVAAFVLSPNESTRRGAESSLARTISEKGGIGVAGYSMLSGDDVKDQEKAKQALRDAGITGAIIMRVIGMNQEISGSPGSMYITGAYPTFWGYWGYGWGAVYSPGYIQTDNILSVETLIYSVGDDQLLWAGQSQTTNPTEVGKVIQELVEVIGKEVRKAGLVQN